MTITNEDVARWRGWVQETAPSRGLTGTVYCWNHPDEGFARTACPNMQSDTEAMRLLEKLKSLKLTYDVYWEPDEDLPPEQWHVCEIVCVVKGEKVCVVGHGPTPLHRHLQRRSGTT